MTAQAPCAFDTSVRVDKIRLGFSSCISSAILLLLLISKSISSYHPEIIENYGTLTLSLNRIPWSLIH
ncbi:MAG TPA: hypothetical protein EYM80_10780 [Deltaproteobacteria bacterium]|nr:hypothetical protein [Deltaproteobacteria bacterium]